MKKLALFIVMSAVLAGCGDDSSKPGVMPAIPPSDPNTPSDSGQPSTPVVKLKKGIYVGTSTEVTRKTYDLDGLIDDKNNAWFIYSENNQVTGFTISKSGIKNNDGKFKVDGLEFEIDGYDKVIIEGDYSRKNMINGRTYDNETNATEYIVKYDEDRNEDKQILEKIGGKKFSGSTYMTEYSERSSTYIDVEKSGSFNGTAEKCNFKGSLTPSGSKSYYKVKVTFINDSCNDNGKTYSGVSFVDNNNMMTIVATNGSKTKGLFFESDDK